MMHAEAEGEAGFTLVELVVSMVVLAIIAYSLMALFTALVKSSIIVKRKAVASTIATNQMEYLKSLPYNNLAVSGGSIITTTPLPATFTKTLNGVTYTVKTSINYVDDAFDGCASYPNQTLKLQYCRNYPPPTGAPAVDQNAEDYKIIHVSVTDNTNIVLAQVDTQVSARVAETASTTGALFVKIIDNNGNPLSGATVQVVNTTLTPQVAVSDSTDSNGTAVFYGLPPDTNGYDYVITGSLSNYSSLTTIAPSGSLQPNYSSQQIFTQQSSFVTLTLKPQGTYSLVAEAVDTNGNPLVNLKAYLKGGYKKYNLTSNTAYYFDNVSPSDTRVATDGTGQVAFSNLVPGPYYFCGDTGNTSCSIGGTTYYLAAAVPYTGTNPLQAINVPTYLASSPPATTFSFGGNNYLQKVRLIFSTSSNYPRVTTLTPGDASQSTGGLSSFAFQITGANLPCSASAASCSTIVKLIQGANTYTASCTGAAAGLQLNCTVNLSAASQGRTQLQITANGFTLLLPTTPMYGGIDVTP